MPRPLRYEVPTVRRVLYIHPDTSAAIDRWCASGNGRTPGQLVDILVRRSQNTPEAKVPRESASPAVRRHQFEGDKHAMGRQCAVCGAWSATVLGTTDCPGVAT